ncbi:hypothetical protein M405DRAFT_865257, partial [Rhizopogon salebrosus TDB-379]
MTEFLLDALLPRGAVRFPEFTTTSLSLPSLTARRLPSHLPRLGRSVSSASPPTPTSDIEDICRDRHKSAKTSTLLRGWSQQTWQHEHPHLTTPPTSTVARAPISFSRRGGSSVNEPSSFQNQENVPSRAYIAFKNEGSLATFSREYGGHLFRDKAVVEFAPFQKIPSDKRKPDARNATIDRDEDYISFLETLKNAEKSEHVSLETLIAASQPPAPPMTTPLLEALKAEKSAQKDKETILRNHMHYKDSAAGNASRKEEVKKKAPPATAAPQKPEPGPAPLSRKAKKAAATQKTGSSAQAAQATLAAKGVSMEGANLPAKPPPHVPAVRTTPRSPRTARQQAPKVPATQRRSSRWPTAAVRAALNGAVGPGGGRKRKREAQPSPASEVVRKDVPGKLKDVSSPSLG